MTKPSLSGQQLFSSDSQCMSLVTWSELSGMDCRSRGQGLQHYNHSCAGLSALLLHFSHCAVHFMMEKLLKIVF